MRAVFGILVIGCMLATASAAAIAKVSAMEKNFELPAIGTKKEVSGRIRGYETIDYIFKAESGRSLQARLKASSTSCYFNVTQAGREEAVFNGSLSGDTLTTKVADTGTYRVRIYLMRNAARRNASCNYTLTMR